MVNNTDQFTLLSAVTTSTVGTAVKVARTTSWLAQSTLAANTGAVTITIEGSIDGTNYATIGTVTRTADTTAYDVNVANNPYTYMRAKTTSQSGATVTTLLRTQSEG